MKRPLALICALLVFTLPSCSSQLEMNTEATTETMEEIKMQETKTKETKTEEKKETRGFSVSLPDGFSVGYAREDVTPQVPIHTYDGAIANTVHDPIQMTCIAMSDGEKIFLLYALDLRGIPTDFATSSTNLLVKKFGIPAEQIFLNCSHTHTSPDTTEEPDVLRWRKLFTEKLPIAAEKAISDLAPATVFSGTGNTQSTTFVRRYLLADGTYKTNPKASDKPVSHETEADNEMRTLRFQREGKKDVVLVNYQTHYGGVSKLFPNAVSADFVHWLREETEKELNCHFGYIQGAAGNLNFNSAIDGERIYPTLIDAIPHLVDTVKKSIEGEKPIQTGKIQSVMVDYKATAKGGGARTLPLRAVGFGEIGFVGAPYEMFDMHGKYIRENSPFATTFISAYTGGRNSYVPHAEGYANGAYETRVSYFAPGSGEEFAEEFLRLLGECKK